MHNQDLTTGSIGKKLLLFFIPIAIGTLFQQLYNTVDAMVVGKFVSTDALAAVGGSAAQVIALTIGFFVALTAGASAVIAQLAGAKREKEVSRAIHAAFTFAVAAGIALTVIGIPLTPSILSWMKTPPDTMDESVLYLRVYFAGSVFMLVFNMGSSILQAMGDSKHPLYYLIACCFCNIALDLLFVVVMKMGIAGAALATVASQLLSCVLILWRFCRRKDCCRLRLKQMRFHGAVMRKMLKIGIPSGIQASMYNISNLIIQVAVNTLGTVSVAAWTVSAKVDGLYTAVGTALGVAVMGFVGQNYGAGKIDRVQKTMREALKIFVPVSVGLGVIVLLFGWYGVHIFNDDPGVIAATWEILLYLAPFYVLWSVIEIVSGSLRGIGDALIPMIITLVGVCVLRLIWVWGVFPIFRSLGGITACYPVSWLLTALALTIYYKRQGWSSKQAGKTQPE